MSPIHLNLHSRPDGLGAATEHVEITVALFALRMQAVLRRHRGNRGEFAAARVN